MVVGRREHSNRLERYGLRRQRGNDNDKSRVRVQRESISEDLYRIRHPHGASEIHCFGKMRQRSQLGFGRRLIYRRNASSGNGKGEGLLHLLQLEFR